MKKTIAIAFLICQTAFVSAQTPTAKPFPVKLDGTIKGMDGKYLYIHHRENDVDRTDSAKVIGGKFSVKAKSEHPDIFWITLSRDPASQPNCFFFADQTPLKSVLKTDSLPFSDVKGGAVQTDFLTYRAIINSFVMMQVKMQNDFNAAVQNNDANTQNAIRNEFQSLNSQYLNAIKSFIRTHAKSPVSAYVLQTDLNNPAIPIQESIEAFESIDKSLANNPYYKGAQRRIEVAKGSTVGNKAVDFTQNTVDGKPVSLSDFRGKYVLLDFWASWCRPCRMENPNVVAAYHKFKDKGFTVLGVSMDTDPTKWQNAIQQDGLVWTHISDLKGWANEAGKLYNITGIPANFLIDREGKIVAKDLRGEALEQKLAELLR